MRMRIGSIRRTDRGSADTAGSNGGLARPVRLLIIIAATLLAGVAMSQPASASSVTPFESGSYYLHPGEYFGVNGYLRGSGMTLVLQYDGNLVLYKNYGASNQLACWASNTTKHPGPYNRRAIMQADGNFVLYLYPGGPAEWASNTASPQFNGDSVFLNSHDPNGGGYPQLDVAPLGGSGGWGWHQIGHC